MFLFCISPICVLAFYVTFQFALFCRLLTPVYHPSNKFAKFFKLLLRWTFLEDSKTATESVLLKKGVLRNSAKFKGKIFFLFPANIWVNNPNEWPNITCHNLYHCLIKTPSKYIYIYMVPFSFLVPFIFHIF